MMNKDMLLHQHHHQPQQEQVQHQQDENMSNLTSASGGDQASVSSGNITEASGSNYFPHHQQQQQQQQFCIPDLSQPQKKRRNQPGNPDPESEVIALSPKTLMATNRFVCEICNKGFQRDQNLQLHRRGHNLPWKLKQRSNKEIIRKKVYVCPEATCVHHDPSRALGDLTGIKKHFCRKHGEKKWKCDKCSKKYAVQSDCKAHSKTCGTKEYRCDCGTLFSRRDSFITHRAFCEALAEETAREVVLPTQNQNSQPNPLLICQSSSHPHSHHHQTQPNINLSSSSSSSHNIINSLHFDTNNASTSNVNSSSNHLHTFPMKKEQQSNDHIINYHHNIPPWLAPQPHSHQPHDLTSSNPNSCNGAGRGLFSLASPAMSATALLQKAAQMGSTKTTTTDLERSTHNSTLTTTMASMMTSPSGFINSNNNNQGLFQDYSASGFDHHGGEEAFDDTFGGFLRTNEATTTASAARSEKSKSGGGEGLTRDFLGIRPLMSHNEILSFAGLGNCINSSASDQLHPKPWQGTQVGSNKR
ncbi:PREDICTED: protein indeterminate-domain 11-like isoform X1 [Camelina sativa]|uniref:Protein indeterminate-domain 11-like isoform X1 n=2 Tax=Camelina sativa TaxID=90675 RepID=A0ABM1RAZ4_CAMSA|nr:PREDICTED: protein indeterminate-domain 11-like isoform X1 [Camelina sativa]XP_010487158.1 PREDICTED: protein indeterminate-domain 11-like isoform X1 [Camelina sativa]XP_019096182.1 PREDICTED: protein indeterminate-domain 11-like isoform X1 [Camelina sativa]